MIAHGACDADCLTDVEREVATAMAIDQPGNQVVRDRRGALGRRRLEEIVTRAREHYVVLERPSLPLEGTLS